MLFEPGHPVKPFSLGARGAWAIAASGANAIAAFAHFDGTALWVISTSAELPALLDGRPVPHSWILVPVPSVLSFGDAEVVISVSSEEPQTHVMSRPSLVPPAPAPVADVTKVAPLVLPVGMPPLPVASPVLPRVVPPVVRAPSLPKVAAREVTRAASQRGSGEATRVLHGPVAVQPARSGVLSAWRKLPARRRAIAVLFPIMLLTVALQAKKQGRNAVGERRASALPASSVASSTSSASDASAAPAIAPSALAVALPSSSSPPSKESGSGKSLERKAADAVVAGDDARALGLYAELSSTYPERAEFSEAHAILQRRAQLAAPTQLRQ